MFLKIFAIFNINPHKIFLKVIENISPCSHVCWRLLHSTPRPQQVPHVGDTGLVTTDRQYRHSFHHLLLLDNLLTTMLLYSPSAASIHLSARCTRPWPGLATNHCTGPGSRTASRAEVRLGPRSSVAGAVLGGEKLTVAQRLRGPQPRPSHQSCHVTAWSLASYTDDLTIQWLLLAAGRSLHFITI